MSGGRHACFGMYPFESLRPAWEALVAALHERLPWVPNEVDWAEDVHEAWRDESCVVSHACGWPVAAQLADHVRVVGAFELALPDARGHEYRSVVLARRPGRLADFARVGVTAAANGPESLSGWVSLVSAVVGAGARWPGSVVWTGSHLASLEALRAGEADVISVDPLTVAHRQTIDPSCLDGLHVVGRGPWTPSPPVVLRVDATDEQVAEVRSALTSVLAEPSFAGPRAALKIDGFVPLERADYLGLLDLTPMD